MIVRKVKMGVILIVRILILGDIYVRIVIVDEW